MTHSEIDPVSLPPGLAVIMVQAGGTARRAAQARRAGHPTAADTAVGGGGAPTHPAHPRRAAGGDR